MARTAWYRYRWVCGVRQVGPILKIIVNAMASAMEIGIAQPSGNKMPIPPTNRPLSFHAKHKPESPHRTIMHPFCAPRGITRQRGRFCAEYSAERGIVTAARLNATSTKRNTDCGWQHTRQVNLMSLASRINRRNNEVTSRQYSKKPRPQKQPDLDVDPRILHFNHTTQNHGLIEYK